MKYALVILSTLFSIQIFADDLQSELFHKMGGMFASSHKAPDADFALGHAWYAGECVDSVERRRPVTALLGTNDDHQPYTWFTSGSIVVLRKQHLEQARRLFKGTSLRTAYENENEAKYYSDKGNYIIYIEDVSQMQYRQMSDGEVIMKMSCPDNLLPLSFCTYRGRFYRLDEAFMYCSFKPQDRLIDSTGAETVSLDAKTPTEQIKAAPKPSEQQPVIRPTLPPPVEIITPSNYENPVQSKKDPGSDPSTLQEVKMLAPEAYADRCPLGYSAEPYRVLHVAVGNQELIWLGEHWFKDGAQLRIGSWAMLDPKRQETFDDINLLKLTDSKNQLVPFNYQTWYKIIQIKVNISCRKK